MKKTIICLAAAGALVLAACGDDDDPTEDAMSSVCDAEEKVLESLAGLASLDSVENTGEDLQQGVDDLQSSVDDLIAARGDLVEQDVDNVTSTFDSLKSALGDLGDVPLSDLEASASATIDASIAEFQAAYEEAYAISSCGTDSE